MRNVNLRSAFVPIAALLVFVLSTQTPASENEFTIPGFPDASLTIYPVMLILTGPVEQNSRFADGYRRKFEGEAKEHARTLGSLLKEEGFDNSEFEDKGPSLKTDYALCATLTLHLEKSFQEVHGVIVDRQGTVVWEESQGAGDPAFDENPPGTELRCLELLCKRLTIPMGLDEIPDTERTGSESQALRELRAKEPPVPSEFDAMEERLVTMKAAEATPGVMIYPARVGGDQTDTKSATNLSGLLAEAALCRTSVSEEAPVLKGEGWPNEMAVLWIFARAARDHVREQPLDSGYALFADYWFAPDGRVWAVHFVVCDQNGDWVIVDMQNSHHEDFRKIDPADIADCDRIVQERLAMYLQEGDHGP